MSGPVRAVSSHDDVLLSADWQVCAVAPDAIDDPSGLSDELDWIETTAPATAASALRAAERWSLSDTRRFDAHDWWWRLRWSESETADETVLCFDGIATVADVWLDGKLLFSSDNMFLPAEHVVSLAGDHELVIRCRSLDTLLKKRRPRPRWRAPMVEHQRLSWFRTTLLGRTPGWSPPAAAVGPWRPVRLERRRRIALDDVTLSARIDGTSGIVEVQGSARALSGDVESAAIVLERDAVRVSAELDVGSLSGTVTVPDAAHWWPHTHGEPALYTARLELVVGGEKIVALLGNMGFREVALDTAGGDFRLAINGVDVFCRGACWTPLDVVSLRADPERYREALTQVRDAGMNMIRVGGTMVYEDDAFYDLADELGILIWQDLMFANMDYPDDESFVSGAEREVSHQLAHLASHPSLALVCGNSEGEQQAAMWGSPRETWAHPLFHETFRSIASERTPGVPYWPSSAHGGAFPHQCDEGTTSYYGVGAYLRAPEDARRAGVRFASECLAFANVPAAAAIEHMPDGHMTRVHQAAWKARVPRDMGAGWDFDDVRDHYLRRLPGVDPLDLRYADHERYLALSRVVTGELMARTFGEWRSGRSSCRGGLVWFLRDLWLGAGWGIIDAEGRPKSVYHYLRRALQPVAIHLSDEGNNGVRVNVFNDRPASLAARLTLTLFRGEATVGEHSRDIDVPAHGASSLLAAELMDGFFDLSHAFRFGPPGCDLVLATLRADDAVLAEAHHLPLGLRATREHDLGIVAEARAHDDDAVLTVRTRRFAQAIAIDVPGYLPDDDHFHLAPGAERVVTLTRTPSAKRLAGTVLASNAESYARIVVAK